MKQLQIMEHNGIRVLTTNQLAECYGCDRKTISYNFHYNQKRYVEGKHYIELKGEDLREFKNRLEIQDGLKHANILQLWTEKGALLHAKSLNTDKAWEVYDYLVDFYFRAKKNVPVKQEQEAHGQMLVDIPENPKIQKALSDVRKYMTTIDIMLTEYNMYRSEESYRHYFMMLNEMSVRLAGKIMEMLEIKPTLVRKR